MLAQAASLYLKARFASINRAFSPESAEEPFYWTDNSHAFRRMARYAIKDRSDELCNGQYHLLTPLPSDL